MATRTDAVEEALSRVRAILATGLERSALERAKDELVGLAERTELWSGDEFPTPTPEEKQARYMIAQDDPEGLTLYLNLMLPGKKIPPHDHTTWACIAAADGVEYNTVFERTDDGSVPERASLVKSREVAIQPGTGLALMPDDIHQVEIRGDEPIRHLHMYGRPLETLTRRTIYDLEAGTCRPMDIGVNTRR